MSMIIFYRRLVEGKYEEACKERLWRRALEHNKTITRYLEGSYGIESYVLV